METEEILSALRQRYQRVNLIGKRQSRWFEIGGLVVLTAAEAERAVRSDEPLERIVASRPTQY